ncbi:MAG: MFS transporter [Solirubrobacteraceae bacterium]
MIALLRRHRGFRLLWTGETTSQIGNSVTTVVVPLIAVTTLHAGAFTVSLLRAAAWLPWLAIGLLAGAWIDQLSGHRRLMIACDLAAALIFATVPLAWVLGDLSPLQLILVALAAGTVSVLFDTAYRVFLLTLVNDRADRAVGNSALQGSASAANAGGPGLGGLLVAALGGSMALLADSAGFLISAVCLAAIPEPGDGPGFAEGPVPIGQRIREGLGYLRHERLLRSLTLFGGTANLAMIGYQSILVVFLVRDTHLRAGAVGLVLALIGVGGITGAALAKPLATWLGSARALLVTKTAGGACALLIPLATSPSRAGFAVAGGLLVGAGIVAGNVITTTFVQNYVPTDLFARTAATNNVINYGTMPLGALLAGVLAATLGLTTALWITTAMVPLASVFLLAGPLPRLHDLPQKAAA